MKLNRLNLLTALISLAGACLWLALGNAAGGLIWLICSLVWLALGISRARSSVSEPYPMRRLARRLSRLVIWS